MSEYSWDSLVLRGALASVAAGLAYLYSTWTYDTFKKRGVPGPRPWPLIGNMADVFRKPIPNTDIEYVAKYGKVYGMFYGRQPLLVVADLDMVKDITSKEFAHFMNHGTQGVRYPKPFDRMVTIIRDDHWKHVRSMLTPTFTSGKLRQMLPAIMDCSSSLVAHIERYCGKSLDVKDLMSAYTMDVIAGTAFGLQTNSLSNDQHPFLKHAQHFFQSATKPTLKIYFMLATLLVLPKLGELLMRAGVSVFDTEAVDYIEAVVQHALTQRQCTEKHPNDGGSATVETQPADHVMEASPVNRRDFLQFCVDHHVEVNATDRDSMRVTTGLSWSTKGLTMGDIMSNAVLFIIAGYETTANLLTFFCYSMAMWPQAQEKVAAEIDEKLGRTQAPSYDSLKQLAYMDQCFHEVLRMYPPVTRLDRECNRDAVINGIHISSGMVVVVPVHAIHYDADVWPNPYEFRPERFEASEKERQHPCAWLPFGLGPRNCVGMRLALLEAQVAAVGIIQRYCITRTADTPAHPFKWKRLAGMLMPEQPIRLCFRQR